MSVEARVDETRSRMNEQAKATERALPLDARDEVVGDRYALKSRSQDELPGMQHESIAGVDLDQFRQVGQILLNVDHRRGVVAKHPKQVRQLDVDRGRLQTGLVKGIDNNSSRSYRLTNTAV